VARSTEEWIGKTDDSAIPPRVRLRVFASSNGHCVVCNCRLVSNRWQADHITALINGGENRESNLRAVCSNCQTVKTKADVAEKSKINRIRLKHIGVKSKKRNWGYGKNDKFRKKITGEVVPR